MKTTRIQLRLVVLGIVAGLSAMGASVVNGAPGKAKVVSKEGPATGATVGAMLEAGSLITTGEGAEVVLDIDGDVVVLNANTTLAIHRLEFAETGLEKVSNVQLRLSKGRIDGRVERFSSLSSFVIMIPKGQVTIDASKGRVVFHVAANGPTVVVEGSANVVFNRGTEESPNIVAEEVKMGQGFDPSTGELAMLEKGYRDDLLEKVERKAPPPAVKTARPPLPDRPFQFFVSPNLPNLQSQGSE